MSLLSYYRDNPEVPDHHKLRKHITRYIHLFEFPQPVGDELVQTTIPGQRHFTPWIVEAPLNSVEVFEAVLKPSQPFTIHNARHVAPRRHPDRQIKSDNPRIIDICNRSNRRLRELEAEFMQGQGQLTHGNEISFVCLPDEATETIRKAFEMGYDVVPLNWISIPWYTGDGEPPFLVHPLALVLHFQPAPNHPIVPPPGCFWFPSYEILLNQELEKLGLMGSNFSRSLLKPGTVPIPETLRNWLLGIPGETAALPYFETPPKEDISGDNRQYTLVLRPSL